MNEVFCNITMTLMIGVVIVVVACHFDLQNGSCMLR